MRLELLNALKAHGETTKLSLTDPAAQENFLGDVRESIKRELENSSTLYGISVQSMFAAMVASLGQVQLIKDEDQGDTYSADDIAVPDFFIVLKDGRRLLVEVKSYFQKQPMNDFTLSRGYLDALGRYAKLMAAELFIVVYFARWNQWMLVPPAAFEAPKGQGKRMRLSFIRAAMANEMHLLGDMTIGTVPPLILIFEMNRDLPQPREDDHVLLTFADDYWTAAGKRIVDKAEVDIATFVALYGDWEMRRNQGIMEGERVLRIEMELFPEGDEDVIRQQGMALIGSLSGMFSKYDRIGITDDEGEQRRLTMETEPGFMGGLSPKAIRATRCGYGVSFKCRAGLKTTRRGRKMWQRWERNRVIMTSANKKSRHYVIRGVSGSHFLLDLRRLTVHALVLEEGQVARVA
jgi:hypothetical protein